jgi:acyl dehydratase
MDDAASLLHFEDFPVGEVITYGRYQVTAEEIVDFAREYDPQPFHIDETAARASLLGGLCASGWHVCAIMMRLMVEAISAGPPRWARPASMK